MLKKKPSTIIDRKQGFVMTNEGLLIPGKFLRRMGEKISVAFSEHMIVISADRLSRRARKNVRRNNVGREERNPRLT
jgi:hypothetical protein